MDRTVVEKMLARAAAARREAYAPYSRYPVGAAVLAEGEIFAGCNVENVSFGLTMCAERVAVFSAVAAGKRRIKGIVLLADGSEPPVPCGACRQVLYEFNPEMWIVCANLQGNRRVYSLPELLPEPFAAFSAEAQTT